MKLNKLIIVGVFLLAILTIGFASAADDVISSDELAITDDIGDELEDSPIGDEILADDGDYGLDVPSQIDYGHSENVTLSLPADSQGSLNVTYKSDGDSEDYTDYASGNLVNGKLSIPITLDKIGRYYFNFRYEGDNSNLLDINHDYAIDIVPDVNVPKAIWTEKFNKITFQAEESYDGALTAYYMNFRDYDAYEMFDEDDFENQVKLGQCNVENGAASIPIANLAPGYYAFRVVYNESEQGEYSCTKKAVVSDENPDGNLSATVSEEYSKTYTGDFCYITVNTPKGWHGNFEVYVDGKKYDISNEYIFELAASSYDLGQHTIEFRFDNDPYYNPKTISYNFKVSNIVISIPDEIVINSVDYVTVDLTLEARGSITIIVDGKTYKTIKYDEYSEDANDGVYSISQKIDGLSFGRQHSIEVKYAGDKFGSVSKKKTVSVSYAIGDDVSDDPYVYGEKNEIIFSLPLDIKNKPVIRIDGVEVAFKNVHDEYDNDFVVDISGVGIGNHSISCAYSADGKYPSRESVNDFEVIAKITVPSVVRYSSGDSVYLNLPKNASGSLLLYLVDSNGIATLYKNVTLVNGYASIPVSALGLGSHSGYCFYDGDDYCVENESVSFNVEVNIICPGSIRYGENKYLVIESSPDDNRLFTLYADYSEYGTIRLENGVGKISLNKLPLGEEIEVEIYSGDGSYIESVIVNVNPIPSRLAGGKNVKMFYRDGTTYSLKVYGGDGKPVEEDEIVYIHIGKKTYEVYTNAKGVAKFTINELPGSYKLVASYDGAKVTNNVVIKKILTLKKVKVKKSAKKLVLTATFKKALKGKKIFFKFNGKKFTAKTNKKGVAKVTVKKNVLKKLKVGKKVKIQASYFKETAKISVKVSK